MARDNGGAKTSKVNRLWQWRSWTPRFLRTGWTFRNSRWLFMKLGPEVKVKLLLGEDAEPNEERLADRAYAPEHREQHHHDDAA